MIDQYPPANGVLTSLIWRKTAAGGETSLSGYDNASQALSYTPGQEQVYLNGILLVRGSDYTATNGTSITGLTALAADDFVQINCYNNFSVASVPAASITGEITNSQITSLDTSKLTGTVANNQLANSSITINGSAVSLGGSVSLPGDIEAVTAGTGISGGGTSGSVTITNSMATAIDAKGDLIVGTGADTFSKLTVGANGTTLVADSAETTGLKWATAESGGSNWTLLNTGGTALTGGATVTVSGISGKDKILVIADLAGCDAGSGGISFRLNNDTANNYYRWGANLEFQGGYNTNNFRRLAGASSNIPITDLPGGSNLGKAVGTLLLSGCNSSGVKVFTSIGACDAGGNSGQTHNYLQGFYNSASTISSVSLFYNNGNFNSGTLYVYTSA